MRPSLPARTMSSRASIRCGVLRRCVPTCTTRPLRRAAASIAWLSTTSTLVGFSTYTSAPALDGLDHRQRVPVVGCRDEDEVEVALGQHLAVVGVAARRGLRDLPGGHHPGGALELGAVHVAERDDLGRGDLQQPEAARSCRTSRSRRAPPVAVALRRLPRSGAGSRAPGRRCRRFCRNWRRFMGASYGQRRRKDKRPPAQIRPWCSNNTREFRRVKGLRIEDWY